MSIITIPSEITRGRAMCCYSPGRGIGSAWDPCGAMSDWVDSRATMIDWRHDGPMPGPVSWPYGLPDIEATAAARIGRRDRRRARATNPGHDPDQAAEPKPFRREPATHVREQGIEREPALVDNGGETYSVVVGHGFDP